jgi:tetratricopeptide (TPR) repeat protein
MRYHAVIIIAVLLIAFSGTIVQADATADLLWKGNALNHMEKYEEAIAVLDEALRIGTSAEVWTEKGYALDKLGRHEEARMAYTSAFMVKPKFIPAWLYLGDSYFSQNLYGQALSTYNQVLLLDPKNEAAQTGISNCLNALGQTTDAQKLKEKA